jgi:hypothetical protein
MSDKYPRTFHLPWSPGGTNDDKRLETVDGLINKQIVITEKMDGSNICFTRNNIFARSHSGTPIHKSFDLAKAKHKEICYNIDIGISIFGEWVYALHSIEYFSLPDYFLGFGIRNDEGNYFYSWLETEQYLNKLNLKSVPVLFEGKVKKENDLRDLTNSLMKEKSCYGSEREGVVVRLHGEISNFQTDIAKFVRENHIQTDEHWTNNPIKKQGKK